MSTTTTYTVSGMTCDHCVAAVTQEVGKLPGVTAVDIRMVAGGESTVAVSSVEPVAEGDVRDAVDEAGYKLTGVLG
jgi:copper chaperone CopZ